jgi:hypothetical protein
MLIFTTWWWGTKFSIDDVAKLAAGLKRNLRQPHRLVVVSDRLGDDFVRIPDLNLTSVKGCFARLRVFDPAWQQSIGVRDNDRLVCIDLDTVLTGSLDEALDRAEPFVIMQGGNASNPCPYNGALFMLWAGSYPDVWGSFSLDAAAKVPHCSFPDDQSWLAHKLPNAPGWKVGPETGLYVYRKPGWPKGSDALPGDARLVTFVNRTPRELAHLDWVREHWR